MHSTTERPKRDRVNIMVRTWRFELETDPPVEDHKSLWKLLKKYWMAFARKFALVNNAILLTLFYLLFIGFPALVMKLFRKDLLDRRMGAARSAWHSRTEPLPSLERSKRQF